MTPREELNLILKLIMKYNLPLSPILEYAIIEKKDEFPEDAESKVEDIPTMPHANVETVIGQAEDRQIEQHEDSSIVPTNFSKHIHKPVNMTIKQFTESVISVYLEKGGTVHPDITLDIFQLIESNKSLLDDYYTLSKGANPTIGKFIRQHFDLRNDKRIEAVGKCSLIKNYMRFHKK